VKNRRGAGGKSRDAGEPNDSNHVKPLDFVQRTKESFERLLSNVLTRSYLGISNITMANMHKKDWDGEVTGERKRKTVFYCSGTFNSSNLEIIKSRMFKEYLMLEYIRRM